MLTKDQILQADDLKTETVDVSEWWGGEVMVSTLSGEERDAFEDSLFKGKGKNRTQNLANLRARLCALTMVDEDGNRLFSDNEVAKLGKKSAAALDCVFSVAQRLNGMSDQDVEEMAKNSEPGQDDG